MNERDLYLNVILVLDELLLDLALLKHSMARDWDAVIDERLVHLGNKIDGTEQQSQRLSANKAHTAASQYIPVGDRAVQSEARVH